jgi:hypothetical protein
MKSLLFVALVLLFSLFVSADDTWEGVYEWDENPEMDSNICYEDGWLFGLSGREFYFIAKVNDDGVHAYGQWYGVGYRQGGMRWTENARTSPSTGQIWLRWIKDGKIVARFTEKGSETRKLLTPLGLRKSTDIKNRVRHCGIINPDNGGNLKGLWQERKWEHNSNHTSWICPQLKDYSASYTYENDGKDVTGYLLGQCDYNGRVCRSDYFEHPYWGVQLDILLADSTMLTLWWKGPAFFISTETEGGWHTSEKIETDVTKAQCHEYSNRIVYPFRCGLFNEEECLANYYYCNIRQTNGECKQRGRIF